MNHPVIETVSDGVAFIHSFVLPASVHRCRCRRRKDCFLSFWLSHSLIFVIRDFWVPATPSAVSRNCTHLA
jgi:hypothetical protein